MKRVINFVKGKREERKENKFISPPISVEITNPAGQKIQSEDEHILGLQSGYGYQIDTNGKDKNMSKLHKAAWQGNLDKVKVHLKKTDVNLVDHLNRTALHFAAAQGHSNVAWFLLSTKASFDIRDADGMTPFLKAIECGNKECVNMLLERGADVNIVDRNGNNGLHLAAKLGFFNIASLLLKKGANFDCSNNVGEFPLHLATEGEHRELVDLLLRAGAHVNVVDRDNRTPLMLAARYGLTTFVSLFLENSASLEACDSNGWTAEDYALIGGHQQLAVDLKVPGREQLNKEAEAVQEIVASCDTTNEVDSDFSDNIKNVPETAEVEINAKPSDLENNNNQELADSIDSFIDNDDDKDDKGDKKDDTDTVESPRSCVTPPPLQPPRSWDLIQAGMIDEKEVQRRSLTALGTLRSRRESFNENNGGTSPHSPHKGQGDFVEPDTDENLKSKINGHMIVIDGCGDANSLASEESLPLDKFSSTLECHEQRTRCRLERAQSVDLTLTEEDPSKSKESVDEKFSSDGATLGREDTLQGYEEIWEKNDNINDNIDDNVLKENNNTLLVINTDATDNNTLKTILDTGQGLVTTEISDTLLQRSKEINNSVGYVTNEIYRTMIDKPDENNELISNTQFIDSNINQPVHVSSSLDNLDEYKKTFIEIESSRSCDNLDDRYIALEENLCCGIYSSGTMTDITSTNGNEGAKSLDDIDISPPLGTVVKRNICREVHSLDMLDDIGTCCSGIITDGDESKQVNKRHARNKSVSVNSRCWSKSFDVLSKPSNIDKVHVDTRKIDAQLECYDEALRELAQVEMLKRNSLDRSSKDSYSSSERKSETSSLKSGYVNSNDCFVVDKHNINGKFSGGSSSSSNQKGCDYFLKLNDNRDFKINQDSNNVPVKIIDKSKSVDCISSDHSDKFNKTNFIEDLNLKSNEMKVNVNECRITSESNFDISLQDLPPPPPELTFNPNILSENDNVFPLTKENVDFLMKQNVDAHKKYQENINVNKSNNNEDDDSDDGECESKITKEFEKNIYKLEKDLFNINTCCLPNENIIESHLLVLPVECSTVVIRKTEIPVESRNGHLDVDKYESSNFNVSSIESKHVDDSSSSAMDRSPEEESPKPPPRPKKSLRKGRSEGEMRCIVSSKNTRSYSASTYHDIVNDFILDRSTWLEKKSKSEAPGVHEKSESDSELCERPLRRKRKILLAMRGVVAGSKDSDDDDDTSAGDPPFWLSTEKGGHFARQDTVVPIPQNSRPSVKQLDNKLDGPTSATCEQERLKENQNDVEKPWTSSDGETASGSGDVTPGGRHTYTIRSHHTMLKEHLRLATNEKTHLEESVAKLREQLERINYELADALQAIAAKDDCIHILEEQVRRLEAKYSNVLDEYQTLQHCVTTQEVELKHLREHCEKLTKEKTEFREQVLNEQNNSEASDKCTCVHDEKKTLLEDTTRLQASKKDNVITLQKKNQEMERRNDMLVAHLEEVMRQFEKAKKEKEILESQNIADIQKLQQDTLMWKEKYEDCIAKLERVDSECRPRLEEAEKTILMLQTTVQKLEAEKRHDQETWRSKFMDKVMLALEDVRMEYGKAEDLLKNRIKTLEVLTCNSEPNVQDSKELRVLWRSKSEEISLVNLHEETHSAETSEMIFSKHSERTFKRYKVDSNISPCNLSTCSRELVLHKRAVETVISTETILTTDNSITYDSSTSIQNSLKPFFGNYTFSEPCLPNRPSNSMCIIFSKMCQSEYPIIKSSEGISIKEYLSEALPIETSCKSFCHKNKFSSCKNLIIENPFSSNQFHGSFPTKGLDKGIKKNGEVEHYCKSHKEMMIQIKEILLDYNLVVTFYERNGLITLKYKNQEDSSSVIGSQVKIACDNFCIICSCKNGSNEKDSKECINSNRDFFKLEIAALKDRYRKFLEENEVLVQKEVMMENCLKEMNKESEHLHKLIDTLSAENSNLKYQLKILGTGKSVSYQTSNSYMLMTVKNDKIIQVNFDKSNEESMDSNHNELFIKKNRKIANYVKELECKIDCMRITLNKFLHENNELKAELKSEKDSGNLTKNITDLKNELRIKENEFKNIKNELYQEKCNNSLLKKQICEFDTKINDLSLENREIFEIEKRLNLLKDMLDQTRGKVIKDEVRIKGLLEALSNVSSLTKQNENLKNTVTEQQKVITYMNKLFEQLQKNCLMHPVTCLNKNNFSIHKTIDRQLTKNTIDNKNIFTCHDVSIKTVCKDNSRYICADSCGNNEDTSKLKVCNSCTSSCNSPAITALIMSMQSDLSKCVSHKHVRSSLSEESSCSFRKIFQDKNIPLLKEQYFNVNNCDICSDLDTIPKPFNDNDRSTINSPIAANSGTNSTNSAHVIKNEDYTTCCDNDRHENVLHCNSNSFCCIDQRLTSYPYVVLSVIQSDDFEISKNNLTSNSSFSKSSVSVNSLKKPEREFLHNKYNKRSESICKSYDPDTSNSKNNTNEVSYSALVSFSPYMIRQSQSVDILMSTNYKNDTRSEDMLTPVESVFIPFGKSCNLSNKGDNVQSTDNEVFPNTSMNSGLLCQAPSTSSVTCPQNEPQLIQLQQKLETESGKRQSLEMQVNKLIVGLQEKLEQNKYSSQKNVLSHENQEVTVGRMRQQALLDSENNLSEKISQINNILQQQMEEQDRLREHSEMQMKKEFELTRQKLLFELSRVQSALKAKEAEERMLREKCEKLTRDVEKSAELKRKQLLEKSYSINLVQKTGTWEKELSKKQSVVVPPPPPPLPVPVPVISTVPSVTFPVSAEGMFSHEALRAQLHESITKHRGDTNLDQQSNIGSASGSSHHDDKSETSSKR